MLLLLVLLTACGKTEPVEEQISLREVYQKMDGCTMQAEVSCAYDTLLWTGVLRCEYVPSGECVVEVLAPETIAGVRARFTDGNWQFEDEDTVLSVGTLGDEKLSPVSSLPRFMYALREGWLLEENQENWNEIPCLRVSTDESAGDGRKIVSTLWLRLDDGTPLRGEIALDGQIILTAEFTEFSFYDKIMEQESADS